MDVYLRGLAISMSLLHYATPYAKVLVHAGRMERIVISNVTRPQARFGLPSRGLWLTGTHPYGFWYEVSAFFIIPSMVSIQCR